MATAREGDSEGDSMIANLAVDEQIEDLVLRRRGLTSRVGLGLAIDHWLPGMTETLLSLGFTGAPIGRRKPRRLYRRTWNSLRSASVQTGVALPILLRACMYAEAAKLKESENG